MGVHRVVGVILSAALLAFVCTAFGASTPRIKDGFTFAAGGDMIGPNESLRLEKFPDPDLETVADHFRNADMGFANMEGSLFDLKTFKGWPAAETGGGYPLAPAQVAKDLRLLGITMVSKANNHATDFGTLGLVATLKSLEAAGIVQAGAGMNLSQARAPAYVKTPKGIVALVDTASSFTPMSVAGAPDTERFDHYAHGRPGISVIHVRRVHKLPLEQFKELRALLGQFLAPSRVELSSGELGSPKEGQKVREFVWGNTVFHAAKSGGLAWKMNSKDLEAVIESIREANRHANFVLFSMHAHQTAPCKNVSDCSSEVTARPAGFERRLFRAAIEAGADAVVRTGPHVLGGIELYKGKPIFYSLGSLFFEFGGLRSYTVPGGPTIHFTDPWFQTVVPVTTYQCEKVSKIRLYPIEIESSHKRTDGRPRPADKEQAQKILKRLEMLSSKYGTRIHIVDGVGIIRTSVTHNGNPGD